MEKIYYNLSEEEFSKGRKILIWIFVSIFFLGGVYVAMLSPVFGVHHIKPVLSLAPFSISLIVGLIAAYATIKRDDIYFLVDDDKIEFRYGVFRPKKYSFPWTGIKEFIMPHKERKVKALFKDGSTHLIDLTYLQRKKATLIRTHLYHAAKEKNIVITKVIRLK